MLQSQCHRHYFHYRSRLITHHKPIHAFYIFSLVVYSIFLQVAHGLYVACCNLHYHGRTPLRTRLAQDFTKLAFKNILHGNIDGCQYIITVYRRHLYSHSRSTSPNVQSAQTVGTIEKRIQSMFKSAASYYSGIFFRHAHSAYTQFGHLSERIRPHNDRLGCQTSFTWIFPRTEER